MHDILLSHTGMKARFAPEAWAGCMLAFEGALAEAEAEIGVIPEDAARIIAETARSLDIDIAHLVAETPVDGLPTIPLVRQLTEALPAGPARSYVHFGATSQDLMDTALVLLARAALRDLISAIVTFGDKLAVLTDAHRDTIMVGRTLLQQALPISFGAKSAAWLDPFIRHLERIDNVEGRCLVLSFGGAAGNLSVLGDQGPAVADALARRLDLPVPEMPWHTSRDRIAELANVLAMIIGSCAKIGRDITLLMQTEIGEAAEVHGAGQGSSTLPHKRNPLRSLVPIAALKQAGPLVASALAAMEADHERAAGAWHGEWPILPRLFELAMAAVEATSDAVGALDVDPERMRSNLEATNGAVFAERLSLALAPALGRAEAKARVSELCAQATRTNEHLRKAAGDDADVAAALSPDDLVDVFDATKALGATDHMIDRTLGQWREVSADRRGCR